MLITFCDSYIMILSETKSRFPSSVMERFKLEADGLTLVSLHTLLISTGRT